MKEALIIKYGINSIYGQKHEKEINDIRIYEIKIEHENHLNYGSIAF